MKLCNRYRPTGGMRRRRLQLNWNAGKPTPPKMVERMVIELATRLLPRIYEDFVTETLNELGMRNQR